MLFLYTRKDSLIANIVKALCRMVQRFFYADNQAPAFLILKQPAAGPAVHLEFCHILSNFVPEKEKTGFPCCIRVSGFLSFLSFLSLSIQSVANAFHWLVQ